MARTSKVAPKDNGASLSNEQRINLLLQQGLDNDTIFFCLTKLKHNLCVIDDELARSKMAEKFGVPCPEYDKIVRQRLMEQIRKCKHKYNNDSEEISLLDSLRDDDGSARSVRDIPIVDIPRLSLGIPSLDEIFGEDPINHQIGIPVGSCTVLGAERGVGKTRLSVEIAAHVGEPGSKPDENGNDGVLFIQNEEKLEIFRTRAARQWSKKHKVLLSSSDNLIQQIALVNQYKPKLVIIDSIQDTRQARYSAGIQGMMASYKAVAADLGIAFFMISHVNGDGGLKGGTYVGHKVDIELFAEKQMNPLEFSIRCPKKNRYGRSNKTALFMHTEAGIIAITKERNRAFDTVSKADLLAAATPARGNIQTLARNAATSLPVSGLGDDGDGDD